MANPRIIAGKARGVRLQDVPGNITRPITDMVKEALFNIIGQDVVGCTLLDLFGGTGSVAIEALSRGAQSVRLIDKNHAAVETIKTNLQRTKLAAQAQVMQLDAFSVLRQSPDRHFDYIFIAPPQYKDMWLRALEELDKNPGWLSPGGWVIVQIDPVEFEEHEYSHFKAIEQRKYGSTLLIFFESIE